MVFLPDAADFKVPPHVTFLIKVEDDDEDKIDNYDGHKWLQLLRTLHQMHENAIRITLKRCVVAPLMLRTLYEEYLNARKPTGVELLIEPFVDQCLHRDVEPIIAELGLQLWDVQQDGESRLYVSMAREGFKFAARFVTHYCDVCVYDGLALRIIKDSA